MEFRLVYKGELLSAGTSNSRVREKHEIRKPIHPQLRQLWNDRSERPERTLETPVS